MVALPLPAVTDPGAAVTLDVDAETVAGVTVTVPVCVTGVPLIVAETVFVSATDELSVPVATPLAFVTLAGCTRVLPLPVAASTTVAPLIGFPLASLAVTVIVDEPLLAWMDDGDTPSVDWSADTLPAVTVTAAVWVSAIPFAVAETAFASTTVELSEPVAMPLAFVTLAGWTSVLPVPVAASTTLTLLSGCPLPFFTVTVIVEVALPTEIEPGAAATVDNEGDTGFALTVTVTVLANAASFAVAETTFGPVTVEVRLPVAMPLSSVRAAGCVTMVPLPVAESTTAAPTSAWPPASFTVAVRVDFPLPAVNDVGFAASVDFAPFGVVTTTLAVTLRGVPLAMAETVFVSATVELRVPVVTPLVFVKAVGCVSVLPLPVD